VRVESEERAHEIIAFCRAHDLELIVAVAPDEPQDITDLWKLLQPERFTVRVEPTAGRNEQCPCGSGRKYKKCCLRTATPAPDSL
jgi:SWIM/SEC-C metal-binding protein